jgi:hypothetical protein
MSDTRAADPQQSLEVERERLRQLILSSWTWQAHGLHGCGLCGAVVHSQDVHLAWHLRGAA